jgi:hypothetical protein
MAGIDRAMDSIWNIPGPVVRGGNVFRTADTDGDSTGNGRPDWLDDILEGKSGDDSDDDKKDSDKKESRRRLHHAEAGDVYKGKGDPLDEAHAMGLYGRSDSSGSGNDSSPGTGWVNNGLGQDSMAFPGGQGGAVANEQGQYQIYHSGGAPEDSEHPDHAGYTQGSKDDAKAAAEKEMANCPSCPTPGGGSTNKMPNSQSSRRQASFGRRADMFKNDPQQDERSESHTDDSDPRGNTEDPWWQEQRDKKSSMVHRAHKGQSCDRWSHGEQPVSAYACIEKGGKHIALCKAHYQRVAGENTNAEGADPEQAREENKDNKVGPEQTGIDDPGSDLAEPGKSSRRHARVQEFSNWSLFI